VPPLGPSVNHRPADAGRDLEERRYELLKQAADRANLVAIFQRYQQVAAHAPIPVMVTMNEVRFSTGGNV
jgi:hypothetical protein